MSRERRWAFMSRKVIGRQDNPMLVRWRLIQTPWFGIYLHFIAREDLDRMPHDHPWTFCSLVLRGGYTEQFWEDTRLLGHVGWNVPAHRTFTAGMFHRFRPTSAHRITSVKPRTTTLVLVGRKWRTWGFYDGDRFIDWRDYHDAPNGWHPTQQHPGVMA